MRHKLGLVILLPLCLGFEWPGRIAHLKYDLSHAGTARRIEAVRMLGHYPRSEAREALLAALEDNAPSVRLEAAAAVSEAGLREATPILLDWMDDPDLRARVAALRALGAVAEPSDASVRAAVLSALDHEAPEVREASVIALHKLGAADATPALLALADDPEASVRSAAIEALAAATPAQALPVLTAHVDHDTSLPVRIAAVTVLGKLRDPAALPVLLRARAEGPEDELRQAAVMALGELGDAGGIDVLREVTQGQDVRLAKLALAALGRIDDPRARARLIAALGQPDRAATARAALLQRVSTLGAEPVSSELVAALEQAQTPAAVGGIADALADLAELTSITSAKDALLSALQSQPAAAGSCARALALTDAHDVLEPLLATLASAEPAQLPGVLVALEHVMSLHGAQASAAQALLAHLATSRGPTRLAIVKLLGMTGAEAAAAPLLPLLQSPERALQLASLQALGAIGSEQSRPALLALLRSDDTRLRHEAALALSKLLRESDVLEMIVALSAPAPADRHALLLALAFALPRLAREQGLSEETRVHVTSTLGTLTTSDDQRLAHRALDAMRMFAPPEGAVLVAQLFRLPPARRRAAAAYALSAFDGEQTRQLLRYVLLHSSTDLGVAVANALAEVGDQRDASALVRMTQRMHWPAPAAASFALARLAQRGVIKKHAMQRTLCALGASQDPYVRANMAAALAALDAAPCDADSHPLRWLSAQHAPAVRIAAAQWARRLHPKDAAPDDATRTALAACANDPDTRVGRACSTRARAAESESSAIHAYAADGQTLLRNRLLALRFPDGAVFVGYSDDNGHLLLRTAPQGELVLEDPTETPAEPGAVEPVTAATSLP